MARTTFSGPVVSTNGFIAGPTSATVTKVLTKSESINFPSISAAGQATVEITVTGAAVGDEVVLGLPSAPAAGLVFNAFVSATNTVSIRASNITASPVDPAAATYGVVVIAAA